MTPASSHAAPGRMLALLGTVLLCGCVNDGRQSLHPSLSADSCGDAVGSGSVYVPDCLLYRGVIAAADHDSSYRLFTVARAKAALFKSLRGTTNFEKGARISQSLDLVTDTHRRGLLNDSARFHRIMDVVSVAIEVAEMPSTTSTRKVRPAVTPYMVWYNYPRVGAHFQPVTTSQQVAHLLPRESVPTDSLLPIAEQLYRYALWREHGGLRFPVWEYQFGWTSGGIRVESPWISAMSQGLVMSIFTEAYRRTKSPQWKTRAYETLNSFKVSWSNGGVMLDDSTHGYWWEEFHPRVMIWNGSVQALVDVGFLWTVTQDSAVKRMFDRGIESLKYYTPAYDTGSWTLYSLTQGHNSVAYHNYHVALLDVLYEQTGDLWFKSTADRWRDYLPPPGID
jgi:hypothetical protein